MSIKRYLLIAAACAFALQLNGCTSGDEKSDVQAADDVENVGEATDVAADDSMTSDALPEESLGTDALADGGAPAGTPESALTTDPSLDASLEAPAAPADATATAMAEPPPPPMPEALPPPAAMTKAEEKAPEPPMMMAGTQPEEPAAPAEEKPKPAPVSLKKVAEKPWKVGKNVFNTVYFAKPGDSLESISQLVYGADKTDVLKAGNPSYKSREPKPGDKVYYSSPTRPTDMDRMLTSYEDTGLQPQIYVAKKGDNIRKLSKQLLGYDGAWKEMWASNPVESKGSLDEGTELRYWASAPVAATAPTGNMEHAGMPTESVPPPAPTVAANEMPPPPPPMPEAAPPPPPPAAAANEMPPPPPPMPEVAQNDIPPPPPIEQMAPPPPPPAPKAKKAPAAEAEHTGMDEDQMMALGVVAVAAAGIAMLLVVRKRRKQKDMEQQIGDSTQVGT